MGCGCRPQSAQRLNERNLHSDDSRRAIQIAVIPGQALVAVRTTGDNSSSCRRAIFVAEKSIVITGFVVAQGKRIFKALSNRMNELPDLQVRMFLNVPAIPGFDS